MSFSITSVNATFQLVIANVYPNGVQLQQFGVDDAFVAEPSDTAETEIGVDAYGVAGYVPRLVPMTVRLQASSASVVVFENWYGYQDQAGELSQASAVILMPSIGRKYTCSSGVLRRASSMAEVRRILRDREFRLEWLPQGPGQPAVSAAPM
jgi:hypothetical protein